MRDNIDNVNQSVLELAQAVTHQVRARQQQELRTAAELTPMEARVIRFFGRHAGATQSDLAEHSGRDKAQVARLVKGLRERGLLDEAPGERADARQVRLVLVGEGAALYRRLRQLNTRLAAQAVAGLSAQEEATLRSLLERVSGNLRAL